MPHVPEEFIAPVLERFHGDVEQAVLSLVEAFPVDEEEVRRQWGIIFLTYFTFCD